MKKIGLFFGSDTGNTEAVATMIKDNLGDDLVEMFDIADCAIKNLLDFEKILIGVPTWYYGELQADWDDVVNDLKNLDLKGKTIGIFGCGDQEDYSEYFLDAMGTLGNIFQKNGAKLVGFTSIDGYEFEASKALINETSFIGLGIDEDRQPELTEDRVKNWCNQLKNELNIS